MTTPSENMRVLVCGLWDQGAIANALRLVRPVVVIEPAEFGVGEVAERRGIDVLSIPYEGTAQQRNVRLIREGRPTGMLVFAASLAELTATISSLCLLALAAHIPVSMVTMRPAMTLPTFTSLHRRDFD